MVQKSAEMRGLKVQVDHLPNPRVEKESHY